MSRRGCLLLITVASALVTQATTDSQGAGQVVLADVATASPTPTAEPPSPGTTATPVPVPTVAIPQSTPIAVPTVEIPQPTTVPKPKAHHKRHHARKRATAARPGTWIWAFLTSYCPASAGWLSSSGSPVFYGMLANDYYPFGTHVYLPMIGITGVVEDRIGAFGLWNHFDVWSPVCYSTPTGWFRVSVER